MKYSTVVAIMGATSAVAMPKLNKRIYDYCVAAIDSDECQLQCYPGGIPVIDDIECPGYIAPPAPGVDCQDPDVLYDSNNVAVCYPNGDECLDDNFVAANVGYCPPVDTGGNGGNGNGGAADNDDHSQTTDNSDSSENTDNSTDNSKNGSPEITDSSRATSPDIANGIANGDHKLESNTTVTNDQTNAQNQAVAVNASPNINIYNSDGSAIGSVKPDDEEYPAGPDHGPGNGTDHEDGHKKPHEEVVSVIEVVCTEATEITTNGKTYTATEPCTITITDCPCTTTHEEKPTSPPAPPAPAPPAPAPPAPAPPAPAAASAGGASANAGAGGASANAGAAPASGSSGESANEAAPSAGTSVAANAGSAAPAQFTGAADSNVVNRVGSFLAGLAGLVAFL